MEVPVQIVLKNVPQPSGALYDVHIALHVPRQGAIAVACRAQDQPEHERLNVALRKAFAQARRRLQDAAREMRRDVKRSSSRASAP